jgi:hypothetical protein
MDFDSIRGGDAVTRKKNKESKGRYWVLFKHTDMSEWMMGDDEERGFESKEEAEACAKNWLEEQDSDGEVLVILGQSVHCEVDKRVAIDKVSIQS